MPKLTRVLVQFSDRQLSALRKLSATTDVPVAAIVRRAVDQFLKRKGSSHGTT